jgi:membrane protease subunit HflK
MREVIGDRTVDELITIGRQDIEIEALARMQELSKRYHLGIRALAHRRSEDLFRAFAR